MRQAIMGGGKIPLTTTSDGSDAGLVKVADRPAFPETYADGGSVTTTAINILELGDLTVYGIPFKKLTFTKSAAVQSTTITWSVGLKFLCFEISGLSSENIDLTWTNNNDDTFSSNPFVIKRNAVALDAPALALNMGDGMYYLSLPS